MEPMLSIVMDSLPIPKDGRKTRMMAILNVTPDSFSDGGRFRSLEAVLDTAEEYLALGADVLDVGGESTRPGARPVPVEGEMRRVLPVITALNLAFPDALVSIDTRKAAVAEAAVEAGARIINDVSGLQYDPAMAEVAAQARAWLVLMHSRGTPETMQQNPDYPAGVVEEVTTFFRRQTEIALAAGVEPGRIILDPGLGFGKTLDHNMALLRNLGALRALGYPVLVGPSRKSFLTLGNAVILPEQREALTAASLAYAVEQGADWVRIHDPRTQLPVLRFAERYAQAD